MRSFRKTVLTCLLLVCASYASFSQCAMCRASAESSLKSGKSQIGKGLNQGILYLMSVPYLLVGVGAWIIIRNKRKQ